MSRAWKGLAAICAAATLAGCVERRIMITSEPTDALVYLNDLEVGRTPLEVDFTYFGVYDIRIRKEGYEPLVTSREAEAPFYEWPGVDLVALAIPVRKQTIIRWHFELEPELHDTDAILERARALSDQLSQAPAESDQPPSEPATHSTGRAGTPTTVE